MKTVWCARCHADVVPSLWTSGPHLRADCPLCDRYVKFVQQDAGWVAQKTAQSAGLPQVCCRCGGGHAVVECSWGGPDLGDDEDGE